MVALEVFMVATGIKATMGCPRNIEIKQRAAADLCSVFRVPFGAIYFIFMRGRAPAAACILIYLHHDHHDNPMGPCAG